MSPVPRRWPCGAYIGKFCGRAESPGEGLTCTHRGSVKRVDHWSCCGRGAKDECVPLTDAEQGEGDFLAGGMPAQLGMLLAPLARLSEKERAEHVAELSQGTGVPEAELLAAIDLATAKFGRGGKH